MSAAASHTRDPLPAVDLLDLIGSDTHFTKKTKTAHEYEGPCPHCGGTDRFTVNTPEGWWLCRHCSPKRGDAAGYLMWRDGITFPEAADRIRQLYGISQPSGNGHGPNLQTFCTARRLSDLLLKTAFGVTAGIHRGRPALLYPTDMGVDRVKYLDGARPKYVWAQRGGTLHWYNRERALARATETGVLYVVNGEPSVWAVHQSGVAAICVCGGEGATPRPEMVAELATAVGRTPVRMVYDRDATGRRGAHAVVAALRAAGMDAAALELPEDLGDKSDVDDLHRRTGDEGLAAAIAALPLLPERQQAPPESSAGNARYADLGAAFGRTRPHPVERPAFPLGELGIPWLEAFCTEGAAAVGAPLDYVAAAVLGACSAALAGAVRLHVMNTFYVHPALWIALVGPPGSGKGPAYALAVEPLQEAQSARYRAYQEERTDWEAEQSRWQSAEKSMRGARPGEPVYRPLLADDATLEGLAPVLEANPRGVGLLNEELAGWLRGMGQYKKTGGNDQEQWLRIHDGRPIEVLRKTDGPRRIERPVVPVLGTTQPEVIQNLLRRNANGLRERIAYCYPVDPGMTALEERPPLAHHESYRALIAGLLAVTGTEGAPIALQLTADAKRAWTAQERILCGVASGPDADPALRGAYSKGRGMAGRLAALLHPLRHTADAGRGDDALPAEVGADTVRSAWRITDWFLDHAAAVFTAGPGEERLTRAVLWLGRHGGEASMLAMMRARLAGDQSARATRELAAALEDRGLVRIEERPNNGARPSSVVVLATEEGA